LGYYEIAKSVLSFQMDFIIIGDHSKPVGSKIKYYS
jgi:hypothetical protein